MRIDYAALSDAETSLAEAARRVRSEPPAPLPLDSGAVAPDSAQEAAAAERRALLEEWGERLSALSRSCAETVEHFHAIDAQIAALIE